MLSKKGVGLILLCIGTCILVFEMLSLNIYRSIIGMPSLFSALFNKDALLAYIVPVFWSIVGICLIVKSYKD